MHSAHQLYLILQYASSIVSSIISLLILVIRASRSKMLKRTLSEVKQQPITYPNSIICKQHVAHILKSVVNYAYTRYTAKL